MEARTPQELKDIILVESRRFMREAIEKQGEFAGRDIVLRCLAESRDAERAWVMLMAHNLNKGNGPLQSAMSELGSRVSGIAKEEGYIRADKRPNVTDMFGRSHSAPRNFWRRRS